MKMFENRFKNDHKIEEKSMKIRCQKDVKIMPAKILPKIMKKSEAKEPKCGPKAGPRPPK